MAYYFCIVIIKLEIIPKSGVQLTVKELWQAIFQCVNHSTFHRGQLIEKLRKLGKTPPATDYVLFCRGIDK
jgi:uncharacterized damage-inducible protein DinB